MKRSILSAIAAASLCLLQACDLSNQVSNGGGDETHSNIDIQGVVLTGRSTPFAGIVVKLRTAGLADTTDARGTYAIQADRAIAAARTLAVVDTLDFYREGRIVHSELLATWVEKVPDVILVQRDVSGRLTGNVSEVKTIQAVFGGRRADTLSLEWNPVLGSYSGFAYFEWSAGVDSHQLRIEARDSLHRMVGRSVDIPFTSRAGDLNVPTFDAGNARPRLVLTGPDSAQSREVLRISGIGYDAFGQMVAVRWPDQGNKMLATHVMPSGNDSVWVVRCTATDAEGLVTKDSLVIRRKLSPPAADVIVVVKGDSVRIRLYAFDVNRGAIREKRIFLGRVDTFGVIQSSNCAGRNPIVEQVWQTYYWDPDSIIPGTCQVPRTGLVVQFRKLDSGIVVKGSDTVLALSRSDSAKWGYQIAIMATDEDGEISISRSGTFHRDTTSDTARKIVSERAPSGGDAADRMARKQASLVASEGVAGGSELPFATNDASAFAGEVAVRTAPGARRAVSLDTGAVRSPGLTPT